MLYNKNQFKKVEDKKVLHKIKKHWVTVSIALLGMIGGGAVATTNASANTTNNNTQNNNANHQLNTTQLQSNQPKLVNNDQANHSSNINQIHNHQPKLVNSNNQSNNQLITNQVQSQKKEATKNNSSSNNNINNIQSINQQAKQLHNQIINNTVKNSIKSSSNDINLGHADSKSDATNTINYVYNGKILSHHTFTGNKGYSDKGYKNILTQISSDSSDNDPNFPKGYELTESDPSDVSDYINNSHDSLTVNYKSRTLDYGYGNINVNVKSQGPLVTDTINYVYNGKVLNHHSFTGHKGDSDTNLSGILRNIEASDANTISDPDFPENYYLTTSDKTSASNYLNKYSDSYTGNLININLSKSKLPVLKYANTVNFFDNNKLIDNISYSSNKKNATDSDMTNLISGILDLTGLDNLNSYSDQLKGYTLTNSDFKIASDYAKRYSMSDPSFISGGYSPDTSDSVRYDGSILNLHIVKQHPTTNIINYIYNNNVVGQEKFTGNNFTLNSKETDVLENLIHGSLNKINVPSGYKLTSSDSETASYFAQGNYFMLGSPGRSAIYDGSILNLNVIPTSTSNTSNNSQNTQELEPTIRTDYDNEFNDETKELNDLTQDIQTYDAVCNDYNEMTTNPSFVPSNLDALSQQNTNLINDEQSAEQNYKSNSNAVASLTAKLDSASKSPHTTNLTNVKPKQLLGNTSTLSNNNHIHKLLGTTNDNGWINSTKPYYGLNYKYNPNTKSVEFTSGTLTWNGYDYSDYGKHDNVSMFTFIGYGTKNKILANAKYIKFDNGVNTSHVTNMSDMFSSNHKLISLILPNSFDTSHVSNMSGMFSGDSNLTSLILPNSFDTSHVSDMSEMFSGDSNLTSLILPNSFDTSHATSMSGMFSDDNNLQKIILDSNFNPKNADISGMFGDDSKLTSLVFPKSFNSKNSSMFGMFSGDSTLSKIVILSPNTKFDNTSYIQKGDIYNEQDWLVYSNPSDNKYTVKPLYKETGSVDKYGNPITLSTPNDFSKGNVGTFISQRNPASASNTSNNSQDTQELEPTIRTDYDNEFNDEAKELNDLTQDIQTYDAVCNDYNEMTTDPSFVPSNLDSLSQQNTNLINDEQSAEQNYKSNSNAVTSLTAKLKSTSKSLRANLTNARPKLLLGAMPKNNLTVASPSTNIDNNKATKDFENNIATLSSLSTDTNKRAIQTSNASVKSYASALQSMASANQANSTNYSNDMKQLQSYNSQAMSIKDTADALNNEAKSANFNSFESLANKANQDMSLADSYATTETNLNSNAMQLTSSAATDVSHANSIHSNVVRLVPTINSASASKPSNNSGIPSAKPSTSNNSKSVTPVSANTSFESSVISKANSIANATNSVANVVKSTSNASSANSYATDNNNLNSTMVSLASNYTNDEILSNNASQMANSASTAGSVYASQANSARSQNNNSLAGSLQGEATNDKITAVQDKMQTRNHNNTMTTIASEVNTDMSSATTNYQNAERLLVSKPSSNTPTSSKSASNNPSSNTPSASASESIKASISQSTSASLSASTSTSNSLSLSASASESLANSLSNSIAVSQFASSVNASKANSVQTSLNNSIANSIAISKAQATGSISTESTAPQPSTQPSQINQPVGSSSTSNELPTKPNNELPSNNKRMVKGPHISVEPDNPDNSDNGNQPNVPINHNMNHHISQDINNSNSPVNNVSNQNESPTNATSTLSNMDNHPISNNIVNGNTSNSNKLPQTNENQSSSKEIATALLSISSLTIALSAYLDKHRYNN